MLIMGNVYIYIYHYDKEYPTVIEWEHYPRCAAEPFHSRLDGLGHMPSRNHILRVEKIHEILCPCGLAAQVM